MRYLIFVVILIMPFGSAALATSHHFWDGGGPDNNIGTDKNWQSNIKPPNTGDAHLTFLGTARTKPYAGQVWNIEGITFNVSTPAAFTLDGKVINIGQSGFANGSPYNQTIKNDLVFTETPITLDWIQLFSNSGKDLELGGDIDLQSFEVKVFGSGRTRLDGWVHGVNGRISVGWGPTAGTLVLGGNIDADVDTDIGRLTIDTNDPQHPNTSLGFAGGTFLNCLGTHVIPNSLFLHGEVTYDGSGDLTVNEALLGSGSLVVNGTTSADLRLGPVNNLGPFDDGVTIEQGHLHLGGNGTIPQLGGQVTVGDFQSSAQTATLRSSVNGDLAATTDLVVNSDGLAETVGPVALASLGLFGGAYVGTGELAVERIDAGLSGRTAYLDAPWSIPTAATLYHVDVTNGSADPDLQLRQGVVGPGWVTIEGDGQVEMGGDPSTGPDRLIHLGQDLLLSRSGGPSILTHAELHEVVRTAGDDQFGTACRVYLMAGATLDMASHEESIDRLNLEDAEVLGTGDIHVMGPLSVAGNSSIEPAVHFGETLTQVFVAAGGHLTTSAVVGAGIIQKKNDGDWTNDVLNAALSVYGGFYRSGGRVTGNLNVEAGLEVLDTDGDGLEVTGGFSSGFGATLEADLDLSGAGAGDEFLLITAAEVSGHFAELLFPAPPAGTYWRLVYTATTISARLETLAQTELDLTLSPPLESNASDISVDGTRAVRFRADWVDPLQVCFVEVDSLWNTGGSGEVGVRLYKDNGTLLASADGLVPAGGDPGTKLFLIDASLQPGESYRLALYGAEGVFGKFIQVGVVGDAKYSDLAMYLGGNEDEGDVFPTSNAFQIPRFRLGLGPCGVASVEDPADEDTPLLPSELALGAYPNPFNPHTTVKFDLPANGRTRVEVFDARGRRVALLLDEEMSPGTHEVAWGGRADDGLALGSGIYFVRMSHPGGERVRRVTLVK